MRLLILLRHAKAVAECPVGGGDFDRPLAPRGLRQLAVLPRMFASCAAAPALILASPAARTRATAEGLAQAFPDWHARLRFDPCLYCATDAEIVAQLANVSGTVRGVCVVAHNPGLTELAERLAGAPMPLPTLGLAAFHLAIHDWSEIPPCRATLAWHASPGC